MDTLGHRESTALRATDVTLVILSHDAPDRNPIEPRLSTLEHRLRHAAEPTRDTVCGLFAQSLTIISAAADTNGDACAEFGRT
jgi:hypothetical protein